MLRFPSQLALKALCNPLRNPLSNPLRNPLQTRHIHNHRCPFSGPPTYATLIQRFSSDPDPLTFFARKDAKEAVERGEFVDIHDIGGVDPEDYDVLITDMDKNVLQSEISKLVGIPYLKEATKDEANKEVEIGRGFLYGRKFRMILPCVLSAKGKAHWVFFVVDSVAPLTYISTQVAQLFDLKDPDPWYAKIAGYSHAVYLSPPNSHFPELNILGNDFCTVNKLRPWVDDGHRTITYFFGEKWVVNPKL